MNAFSFDQTGEWFCAIHQMRGVVSQQGLGCPYCTQPQGIELRIVNELDEIKRRLTAIETKLNEAESLA